MERAPWSQPLRVQKEMSSKVPAVPPNPTHGSHPLSSHCGFMKPGLGGVSGSALHPLLPVFCATDGPTDRALSSFGELFPSLSDEAVTPLFNFVTGPGKEDVRTQS